ncbi:hypothetical protein LWI29_015131 [Acer saccharum]|uniref:Uncharacterized protein n=1 Tax=Acer saccharum TaxID=4024 RepID=A0AA39S828_ACESA|nr:hypothetical protein LWI29_015131 [Acer saccharum]
MLTEMNLNANNMPPVNRTRAKGFARGQPVDRRRPPRNQPNSEENSEDEDDVRYGVVQPYDVGITYKGHDNTYLFTWGSHKIDMAPSKRKTAPAKVKKQSFLTVTKSNTEFVTDVKGAHEVYALVAKALMVEEENAPTLFFPFWFSEKDFREKTEDLCRLGLLCCQLLELQKSSGFVISLYLSLSSSSSSTLASNFGLLKFYTETYRDSPLFPCNQDQKWILFGESVLKIV